MTSAWTNRTAERRDEHNPIWIYTSEPSAHVSVLEADGWMAGPTDRAAEPDQTWSNALATVVAFLLMLVLAALIGLLGVCLLFVDFFRDVLNIRDGGYGRPGQVMAFAVTGLVVSMVCNGVSVLNSRRSAPLLRPVVPGFVVLVAYLWLKLPS